MATTIVIEIKHQQHQHQLHPQQIAEPIGQQANSQAKRSQQATVKRAGVTQEIKQSNDAKQEVKRYRFVKEEIKSAVNKRLPAQKFRDFEHLVDYLKANPSVKVDQLPNLDLYRLMIKSQMAYQRGQPFKLDKKMKQLLPDSGLIQLYKIRLSNGAMIYLYFCFDEARFIIHRSDFKCCLVASTSNILRMFQGEVAISHLEGKRGVNGVKFNKQDVEASRKLTKVALDFFDKLEFVKDYFDFEASSLPEDTTPCGLLMEGHCIHTC